MTRFKAQGNDTQVVPYDYHKKIVGNGLRAVPFFIVRQAML